MNLKKLMRVAYRTDVSDDDPDYIGSFSEPFPDQGNGATIVGVDWSVRGVVEVTFLVSA